MAPGVRASATARACVMGREVVGGRRSRGESCTALRASGNRNKRAQAGLIVDQARSVEEEVELVFFEDAEGEDSGSGAARRKGDVFMDFDFEKERTKLLNERRQLEEILERIDEHEKSLAVDAEGSRAGAAGPKSSSPSAPSSTATPARLRRDRYRTSLQRPSSSSARAAEVGGESEGAKAKASKGKGRGRPRKRASPRSKSAGKKGGAGAARGLEGHAAAFSPEFVSKSSEESLSVASTSSSADAVTTLLQERRHLSLLSREEEARLIEKAQFCFVVENAVQEALGDGSAASVPSYDRLAAMINKSVKPGQKKISPARLRQKHTEAMEARRFMLDHNVRLVVHLAHRYRGKGVSLGDLVQEGIQGLLTAIEKFDLSRNLKFSTYATWWIKQSLIRGICNYSRDVRLPVHITDTFQKMNKIQREAGKGRIKYSVEELADLMDCKVNKLQNVLESTRTAISLEVLCGANNNNSSQDSKPLDIMASSSSNGNGNIEDALTVSQSYDVGDNLDSELYEKILQDDVDAVLKMLPPRERNILRMRFGLTPIDDMCLSLVDIGAAYGLTRERVRQMEARALNKLRQPKLSTKLKKYIHDDYEH